MRTQIDYLEAIASLHDELGNGELIIDDAIVVHANEALCRMLEYSVDELIGKPFRELLPAEYHAELAAVIARAETFPTLRRFECRLQGKHRRVWFQTASRVSRIGEVVRHVWTLRDVSEHRETPIDEQIRSGLQATFAHAPVGIAHADLTNRLVVVNKRFCQILGYEPDELRGRRFTDLTWPDDVPAVAEAEVQQSARPGSALKGEWRFRHKRGHVVWLTLMAAPLCVGDLRLKLTIVDDITARKRVEEERARLLVVEQQAHARAVEASRMKDDFLAIVSHELRTPLTSVLGWSQVLLDAEVDEQRRVRGLQSIARNAQAQCRIVEELLDVSSIVKGKVRLRLGPVDLGRLVSSAVDGMRPAARAKSIGLQHVVEGVLPVIDADEDRLLQVVWNLLSNAVKFTPLGGRITVRCAASSAELVIAVSDTGKGISREFLPHVFERFRQEEDARTRTTGGLGLGLALVQDLVALHGGTVTADSAGEGRGSTFTVRLPASLATSLVASTPAPRPSAPPPAGVLAGVPILLVDDDADARELFQHVLERVGARVTVAASASAALAAIERAPPTVLVSDIGMPGLDGYDLVQAVRSRTDLRIAALALTAFARPDDRARAIAEGYDAHLAKPVDPDAFVAAVAGVVCALRRRASDPVATSPSSCR